MFSGISKDKPPDTVEPEKENDQINGKCKKCGSDNLILDLGESMDMVLTCKECGQEQNA